MQIYKRLCGPTISSTWRHRCVISHLQLNLRMKEKQEMNSKYSFLITPSPPTSWPCCSLPQVKAAAFQHKFKMASSSPCGFLTVTLCSWCVPQLHLEGGRQPFCYFTISACYDKYVQPHLSNERNYILRNSKALFSSTTWLSIPLK